MQARLLRTADRYFGFALYWLCWLFLPLLAKKAESREVLVVKLWALGESVLILPSVKALHDKGCRIAVICTKQNAPVFYRQPFIDRLIVFDFLNPLAALSAVLSLRKYSFAAAIDSDPYMKFSAVLAALSGAKRRVGLENRKLLYTAAVPINENEHAVLTFWKIFAAFHAFPPPRSLVPVHATRPKFTLAKKYVVIHAGSASASKMRRWPEENFAALCDYFSSRGFAVYLVGSVAEKKINSRIAAMSTYNKEDRKPVDLSGLLSLHELAWLFSRASLVVANDSGPMHIAAAMGVPTIGLFGPNLPERFGPYGKKCVGIRKDTRPPCILPFRARFPECSHDHMKSLGVKDVIAAVEKII